MTRRRLDTLLPEAKLLACFVIGLMSSLPAYASPPKPLKVIAISQQQTLGVAEVPGVPSDSILFYDVTNIGTGPVSNVFNNSPLFSVWAGFEIFDGNLLDDPEGIPAGNREDFSALAQNPANGTIYALAFDSGSVGVPDPVGDRQGDWDLYRINYQAILKDYVTNARPHGTIYAPTSLDISITDETFMRDNGSIYYDGTIDGEAQNIPHPSDPDTLKTVFLPGAFTKVGQPGRSQTPASFFDHQMSFINPDLLTILDANTGTATAATQDFTIKTLRRISTSPNVGNEPRTTFGNVDPYQTGSFHNGPGTSNASESWESRVAGFLQLDGGAGDDPNRGVCSEPVGWSLVNTNGVLGVWVADDDQGVSSDDLAYYELNFSDPNHPVATKKTLAGVGGTKLSVTDNPEVNTATPNGDVDGVFLKKDGSLVIMENGFFNTNVASTVPPLGAGGKTAQQPKAITVGIGGYGATVTTATGTGFLDTAAYDTSANMPITLLQPDPNDTDVIRSDRVAIDKTTGYLYIMDRRDQFTEDIYVFDPVSGTIVYSEANPFDIGISNRGTMLVFTRGDINGDGSITYADIQKLQDGVVDNTLGGIVSAATGREWYDMTGDGLLTAADVTELVQNILGTRLGDFNLNGTVDGNDFLQWQLAAGGTFDSADLTDWNTNYGFVKSPLTAAQSAVPEPASAVLLCLAFGGMVCRRSRR